MGFFKRLTSKLREEDSVVVTAQELDEIVEDRKKRKKKKETDPDAPDTDS